MQKKIQKFVCDALDLLPEMVVVEVPGSETHGHYATNVAMRMAKEYGKAPMALAQEFSQTLKEADKEGMFEKIEAVPPGFINFTLSPEFLHQEFAGVLKQGRKFGQSDLGKQEKIIVEYSDPNIAKPMHVGHLRATIIGDALANIFEFLGYEVTRWNYIGDWGTQFGKLIAAYKRWGSKEAVEKNPIKELLALYIKFHEEVKTDPSLEGVGQAEFKKLEDGDKESVELWEWFKKESLVEFDKMYDQLKIEHDVVIGEAFYAKEMPRVTKMIREGIGKESEGALVVELDEEGLPPALIEKQDGASLYITRDIANIEYREKEYGAKKVLYVVGNEQSLHFAQLFAINKKLGLTDAELVHVKYGLVLGEDGKKLSTRDGKTISLQSLVDTIIEKARVAVTEKNRGLSPADQEAVAKAVGIGALKYNDLKENRVSDIVFNWDEMLSFSGNSAPYLQYTVARVKSLVKKAEEKGGADYSALKEEAELSLIKKILDFPDVVELCEESYLTSHLATYLYQLAKQINAYYESTRVLDDEDNERKMARLALFNQAGETLGRGLELLGIETPEQI